MKRGNKYFRRAKKQRLMLEVNLVADKDIYVLMKLRKHVISKARRCAGKYKATFKKA